MRFLLLIFSVALLSASCVKRNTKNPVPTVEFLDFAGARKSTFTNSDTATIILSYEDGDGDLFVDNFSDGANIQITPYKYDSKKSAFVAYYSLDLLDTIRYSNTIKQPDNGYYKGKSIKGEIFIPMTQFRENDDVKLIKFRGFMTDRKGHRSNIFSSPSYSLNF